MGKAKDSLFIYLTTFTANKKSFMLEKSNLNIKTWKPRNMLLILLGSKMAHHLSVSVLEHEFTHQLAKLIHIVWMIWSGIEWIRSVARGKTTTFNVRTVQQMWQKSKQNQRDYLLRLWSRYATGLVVSEK